MLLYSSVTGLHLSCDPSSPYFTLSDLFLLIKLLLVVFPWLRTSYILYTFGLLMPVKYLKFLNACIINGAI